MRIGVLTLTQSENYGTVLQAAATAELLRAAVPDASVTIVPTDVPRVRRRRSVGVFRWRTGIRDLRARSRNLAGMRNFISPYLASQKIIDASDFCGTVRQIRGLGFDAFVSGSDEIWNLSNIGVPSIYYAPPPLPGPKVSLATSANRLDFDRIRHFDRDWLRYAVADFRRISVRDNVTAHFIGSLAHGDVPINEVPDPTLLWGERWLAGGDSPRERSGILLMMRADGLAQQIVERFGSRAQIDSVFLSHPGTRFLQLDPVAFARAFGRYRLVVTDFFHGTCMSILNHSPFVSIDHEPIYSQYESKIADLLGKLDLKDRYLNLSGTPAADAGALLLDKVELTFRDAPDELAVPALDEWRARGAQEIAELSRALTA